MADLDGKTLAGVKPGWLHNCFDGSTNPSELNVNTVSTPTRVFDGNNNKSSLWLTRERGVLCGNTPAVDYVTNTKCSLFVNSRATYTYSSTAEPTHPLIVETHSQSHINIGELGYYKINGKAYSGIGNAYNGDDETIEHNQFVIQADSRNPNTETALDEGSSIAFLTGDSMWAQHRMIIDSTGQVGIGTTVPSANLHVIGDIKISSGMLFSDSIQFYVDAINGDDANSGLSMGNAYQTLDALMSRLNGAVGVNITVKLVGFDNTSTGNISDNEYVMSEYCTLYNSSINFKGVKFDNSGLGYEDIQHDLPRLRFEMDGVFAGRIAKSLGLVDSTCTIRGLRLITPIYTAHELTYDSQQYDGLINGFSGNCSIHIQDCRVELGDAPLISSNISCEANVYLEKCRIIRTNTGIQYGTIGQQSNGQDSTGIASIPTWETDHYENVADDIDLGTLTNTIRGSIYVVGDAVQYSTGQPGTFGAYPQDDSTSYSYDVPNSNDQSEAERNLFGNRNVQYILTNDGATAGKIPINFKTNKFADSTMVGWYTY